MKIASNLVYVVIIQSYEGGAGWRRAPSFTGFDLLEIVRKDSAADWVPPPHERLDCPSRPVPLDIAVSGGC
jgi:hypothetical protein